MISIIERAKGGIIFIKNIMRKVNPEIGKWIFSGEEEILGKINLLKEEYLDQLFEIIIPSSEDSQITIELDLKGKKKYWYFLIVFKVIRKETYEIFNIHNLNDYLQSIDADKETFPVFAIKSFDKPNTKIISERQQKLNDRINEIKKILNKAIEKRTIEWKRKKLN